MLVNHDLIIFLVYYLSYHTPTYISRIGLEYAVQDYLEEHEDERENLNKALRNKPVSLLELIELDSKWRSKIGHFLHPFLTKPNKLPANANILN